MSRKHLVIAVSAVKEGDGVGCLLLIRTSLAKIHKVLLHNRSKIIITDDSKLGTSLDDVKFIKEARTLIKPHHTIQLGSYDQSFR